jgi:hypothetical protein
MSIVFTNITLRGDKQIKPDEDGYYHLPLGKFNAFNKSGIFYKFTKETEALIKNSRVLNTRIAEGKLKGEFGHPMPEKGMSSAEYLRRLGVIKESNVAVQIREFTLHDANAQGEILVTGKVRPAGPYADSVRADFEDKFTNIAMSLRSIVHQQVVNGVLVRTLKDLITWDYVGNNGIQGADKAGALKYGLESNDVLTVEDEDIPELLSSVEQRVAEAGLESEEGQQLQHMYNVVSGCKDGSCYLNEW